MAGERLAKMISECKPKESELTDLVFGDVTSTSPLRIKIRDNTMDELYGNFLMLSSLCRPGTPGGEALRVGDTVRMLRCNSGQLYYVLEKERYTPVRHCECCPICCECECEDNE
jgi:hypothetical protein